MNYKLIKDLEVMGRTAIPSGFVLKQEDDGLFYLVYDNVQLTYSEEELKNNTEYFKLDSELPTGVSELKPDLEVKEWRIQLDVTTDKETLLKIDRAVKAEVKRILKSGRVEETTAS